MVVPFDEVVMQPGGARAAVPSKDDIPQNPRAVIILTEQLDECAVTRCKSYPNAPRASDSTSIGLHLAVARSDGADIHNAGARA
jgi:hypothetical protein